jgi:hypothetical protein
MKITSIAFVLYWISYVSFVAGTCRAENQFKSSEGDSLTVAEVNNAMNAASDSGKDRSAEANAQQSQLGASVLSKQITDDKPFVAAASGSGTKTSEQSGKQPDETENSNPPSDSAFNRYLLGITTGIGMGVVFLTAWLVQWRRQRSMRKYWLFPTVQNCNDAVEPGGLLSVQLMEKKQPNSTVEENVAEAERFHRAA